MDIATTSYQRTLPLVLHSISPKLSALHAARARFLYPDAPPVTTLSCSNCGCLILPNTGNLRVGTRKPKRGAGPADPVNSKTITKTCFTCGFVQTSHFTSSKAHTFKTARKSKFTGLSQSHPTPNTRFETLGISLSDPATRSSVIPAAPSKILPIVIEKIPPTPVPLNEKDIIIPDTPSSSSPKPKSRPKKPTGLQQLLAKNREQQEKKKASDSKVSGLMGFLDAL
jgi:hypothetical protein